LNLARPLCTALAAPAALALTPLAHSQPAGSVQLYGSITAAAVYKTDQVGGSLKEIGNSLLSASFFGLRGTEDLGGGMSAVFRLESPFGTDTGNSGTTVGGANKFWARQSFVGLNLNPALAATAGRQFHAATDRVIRSLDVYNVAGTSLHSTPLALLGVNRFAGNDGRVDDSVKLRLTLPAVQAGASVGMDDGAGRSVTVDVAHVAAGFTVAAWAAQFNSPTVVAATGNRPRNDLFGVGGNVQLGPVRLYVHYLDGELEPTAINRVNQTNQFVHLGVSWNVTPAAVVKVAGNRDEGKGLNGIAGRNGTKTTWVASGEYFLSRRTSLHVAATSNSFSGGYRQEAVNLAGLGRDPAASSTRTLSAGMRHDF
jgi:predicted porin